MKFPSIKEVASELRLTNANVEGECDVRLQVYEDGKWVIRSGLSDYDQDHHGFWGASSVPGVGGRNMQPRRFDSVAVAKELLDQAKEQHAQADDSRLAPGPFYQGKPWQVTGGAS